MKEWVTYSELADQYDQSARSVSEMIAGLRQKYKTASPNDRFCIRRSIAELYKMHGEAKKTAAILRTYSE